MSDVDSSDGRDRLSEPDETTRDDVGIDDEPADRDRGAPRWWPLTVGVVLGATVIWVSATRWVGYVGSHPIGWVTLLVVAIAAIGLVAWALFVRRPTIQRAWVRLAARVGMVVAAAVAVGLVVYTRPFPADQVAIDALSDGDGVDVEVTWNRIRMEPDEPLRTGLAFYPGARVDPRAYARILRPLAEAGYPVVVFKMPYNLAILDSDAANAVIGDRDDAVDRWVIAGHSLGGAMAGRYAESPRDELVGLLFHAAFPPDDLSDRTGLHVVSVSGTEDGYTTVADIAESVADLPPNTDFVAIDGAIHSFFGDYGLQPGDGEPGISRDDAQHQIVDASLTMLADIDTSP